MSNFRFTKPEAFPPIIKNLIIINVLVWLAQLMYDKQFELTSKLGLWTIQVDKFKLFQFATHMFAHESYDPFGRIVVFHIFFSMITFWMLARILEYVWGAKRYL